jgi:carboxymethylenebutenolidase
MLTPIKIDNRMDGYLGKPAGAGKRAAVIHLHERYGIVQHTTDLGEKFVDAGYVTIVPDLFSRFTGDRVALAAGNDRCDLDDEQVLGDIDAVLEHLRGVPEVDMARIAISGVCQTGRQPILMAAKRSYIGAAVVLYGAIYDADWKSDPRRPEPIDKLIEQMSCPMVGLFGELDNLIPLDNIVRMVDVLAKNRKSFDVRVYPDAPHGFLNDTMPGRFRPQPAQSAWNQITTFLDGVFGVRFNKERAIWRFESDSSVHYDFTKMKRWE